MLPILNKEWLVPNILTLYISSKSKLMRYQLYLWTFQKNWRYLTVNTVSIIALEHLSEVLVRSHKQKYSILTHEHFHNPGHWRNVVSLEVIKNANCIYFLRALLARLWVMLCHPFYIVCSKVHIVFLVESWILDLLQAKQIFIMP